MNKLELHFYNRDFHEKSPGRFLSSVNQIKKLFILSSFFVFSGFFLLKAFVKPGKFHSQAKGSNQFLLQKDRGINHILPVLLNLKGSDGPQVAEIQVHIQLDESNLNPDLLFQGKQIEKHILFVLSGQSVEDLTERSEKFERQIQEHLNAFLSNRLVDGVEIKTTNF